MNDKPNKHWEKIINYKKATIYLVKKTKPQILILITMAFMVCSCESILEVADNSENPLTEELGLDRSNCISCLPAISNQTLENQELTFNTNHMPCIHLEMNAADFETMWAEKLAGKVDKKDQIVQLAKRHLLCCTKLHDLITL